MTELARFVEMNEGLSAHPDTRAQQVMRLWQDGKICDALRDQLMPKRHLALVRN